MKPDKEEEASISLRSWHTTFIAVQVLKQLGPVLREQLAADKLNFEFKNLKTMNNKSKNADVMYVDIHGATNQTDQNSVQSEVSRNDQIGTLSSKPLQQVSDIQRNNTKKDEAMQDIHEFQRNEGCEANSAENGFSDASLQQLKSVCKTIVNAYKEANLLHARDVRWALQIGLTSWSISSLWGERKTYDFWLSTVIALTKLPDDECEFWFIERLLIELSDLSKSEVVDWSYYSYFNA